MSAARTVHWRVNCYCNRRCPFCYGPQNRHEVRANEALPVLEQLVDFGIRAFVLTGGEPLLSKKMDEVLRLLHNCGASVALYTNCDFFDFHEDVILECVDTLCIPLDGGSEYSHDRVRGKNNFRAVLSVLDRHAHGAIKVKVGTVLGRHNIFELPAIAYTLERYRIESWKLYEYLRYEDRDLQKSWAAEQLGISAEEYRHATGQLLAGLAERKSRLKATTSTEYDRANSYFMINPDMEVVLPFRDPDGTFRDISLCNALDTPPEEIDRIWREQVDIQKYDANIASTFSWA